MISKTFIERPKFAMVIALIITLSGLISMTLLPVSEYPEVAPPQVKVQARWPGASALVMEESVGQVIEDVVNGVEGMEYMSSNSANDGSYNLTITFGVGDDPDMALVRVQNRVKLAEPSLPAEVRAQELRESIQKERREVNIANIEWLIVQIGHDQGLTVNLLRFS